MASSTSSKNLTKREGVCARDREREMGKEKEKRIKWRKNET